MWLWAKNISKSGGKRENKVRRGDKVSAHAEINLIGISYNTFFLIFLLLRSLLLERTYIWKGNFGGGALLQQQFASGLVEQEHRKGPVQYPPGLLLGEFVRSAFRFRTHHVVVVVQHQHRVLFHHVALRHGRALP